ncbi:hypothetical protein F5B18DRAFT_598033 [Nemania serpens]|nr:hypothetical protein F5B18DRAFT_598033 [Nemania serpens]
MPVPPASPPNLHAIRAHQAPPSQIPIQAPQHPQQPRDASNLHPVFFTRRLQRSPSPFIPLPNGVVSPAAAAGVSGVLNPVAHGYVYRDERQLRGRAGVPML